MYRGSSELDANAATHVAPTYNPAKLSRLRFLLKSRMQDFVIWRTRRTCGVTAFRSEAPLPVKLILEMLDNPHSASKIPDN